jgi:hypothetical protein
MPTTTLCVAPGPAATPSTPPILTPASRTGASNGRGTSGDAVHLSARTGEPANWTTWMVHLPPLPPAARRKPHSRRTAGVALRELVTAPASRHRWG